MSIEGFCVKCLVLGHTADPEGDGKPKVRNVSVSSFEASKQWGSMTPDQQLDFIWQRGQNDFSECFPEHNSTYSLSVADVICLPDEQPENYDDDDKPYTMYAVCSVGFKPITDDELQQLIDMEAHDRHFCKLLNE
jgi:hypothetical protein